MKKYLLGLFVGLFGLMTFCNAGSFTYNGHFEGTRPNAERVVFSIPAPLNDMTDRNFSINCTFSNYTGVSSMYLKLHELFYSKYTFSFQDNIIKEQDIIQNNVISISKSDIQQNIIGFAFYNNNAFSDNTSFDYTCVYTGTSVFGGSCPECQECETCPEINTGDILSGSCDTNYCVENDLCPVPSNFSQLFINDIEFPGKPLINVSIPDYIHWDYFSNDTGFDLYVGSGYDVDYINSIVDINSYRPTSEDFTSIFINGLTLIFPYLIFTIFLVFMWKLIKRIFKH